MNPHFASLVLGLAHQAESALQGQLPAGTEAVGDARKVAQTLIDTLGMLAEKTDGRLDDDERKLLDGALTALRFRFVQSTVRSDASRRDHRARRAGHRSGARHRGLRRCRQRHARQRGTGRRRADAAQPRDAGARPLRADRGRSTGTRAAGGVRHLPSRSARARTAPRGTGSSAGSCSQPVPHLSRPASRRRLIEEFVAPHRARCAREQGGLGHRDPRRAR